MASKTSIEWTHHTFNPWIGCAKVSEGCKHCYAEVDTYPRVQRGRGLELWGADAQRHITSESYWRKPLAWNRDVAATGTRARVFCASLADVFEDRPNPRPGYAYNDTLRKARARLWRLIHETPHLDWLLLTKRPENAERLAIQAWGDAFGYASHNDVPKRVPWMPNIWLGTTVENQARADERIQHVVATRAAVKFLSVEPMLGGIELHPWLRPRILHTTDGRWMTNEHPEVAMQGGAWEWGIGWVIVGGESGHHARPFNVEWARSIVRQCRDANVPVLVKQLGADPVSYSATPTDEGLLATMHWSLRDRKGGDPDEWPEDLRVREFPEVRT